MIAPVLIMYRLHHMAFSQGSRPTLFGSSERRLEQKRGRGSARPSVIPPLPAERLGAVLNPALLKFGLNDYAKRVVRERARLQGEYVFALYGLRHEQLRRLHLEGLEHFVGVLPAVGVLDKDLVALHDVVYVPEGEETGGVRVAQAVPGYVDVGLLLPWEARTFEVDAGEVPERILIVAERVGNGGGVYALHAGHRERQSRIIRSLRLLCGALLLLGRGSIRRDGLVGSALLVRAAACGQSHYHRQGCYHQQKLPHAHARHLRCSACRDRRRGKGCPPVSRSILYQSLVAFRQPKVRFPPTGVPAGPDFAGS